MKKFLWMLFLFLLFTPNTYAIEQSGYYRVDFKEAFTCIYGVTFGTNSSYSFKCDNPDEVTENGSTWVIKNNEYFYYFDASGVTQEWRDVTNVKHYQLCYSSDESSATIKIKSPEVGQGGIPKCDVGNSWLQFNSGDVKYISYDGKTQLDNQDKSNPSTGGEPTNPGGNKYDGVTTCNQGDLYKIKDCGCIPAEIADISSKAYFILRIVGPVLLIIVGGVEMGKAVASQDESSIEKAKKKLVNKFIAAAAIFLILTIIKTGVNLVSDNTESIFKCVNTLLEGYDV